MANERLKDFPAKPSPVAADIVYIGDSADSFNEVYSTIGEIFSGYSAALASLAALSSSANQMPYYSGVNTFAITGLTAYARTILDDVDAAAARTTLGIATPFALSVGGTGAALTAVNGGIVYSNATTMAISAAGSSGQLFQSAGTGAPGWTTATYPATAGASGNIIISNGTNYISSTSLWPNTVGTAGKIVRSDGTTNAYTTSTFADTYAVSTLLYASSTNAISGLATGNDGVLITSAGGIPSISSTLPSAVQTNITALGSQAQALNMNSHLINNVTNPVSAQDAATMNYVLSVAQGRVFKDPVDAATTAAFSATYSNGSSGIGATLTGTVMAAFAPDGVTLAIGDRVLFKDQGSSFQNGIYTTTVLGTGAVLPVFTRATDMDLASEFKGATTFIIGGAEQAGQTWTESLTVVTIGTDAVTFVQTGDATSNSPCAVSVTTTGVSNVTGDGTDYVISFDTIIENLGGAFSAGTTFTAPATGRYLVEVIIGAIDISVGMTNFQCYMQNNTAGTFYTFVRNAGFVLADSGTIRASGGMMANLTLGDVCQLHLAVSSSTKTVDLESTTRWSITRIL